MDLQDYMFWEKVEIYWLQNLENILRLNFLKFILPLFLNTKIYLVNYYY